MDSSVQCLYPEASEWRVLLLQSFVFALFATAMSGAQGFGDLRETDGAIALGLAPPVEVLLFFELLKSNGEVDGWKIFARRIVLV